MCSKKSGHTGKFENPPTAELDGACWKRTKTWHPGSTQAAAAAVFTVHLSFLLSPPPHPSQAIRELQEEVSRLRLRLEDSLHQHLQGSPKRPASNFDHPARARDQPADFSATWGSHYGRWVNPKLPPLCPGGSYRGSSWPTSGSPQTCGHRHSHIPLSRIHSFIHSYFFFYHVIFDT